MAEATFTTGSIHVSTLDTLDAGRSDGYLIWTGLCSPKDVASSGSIQVSPSMLSGDETYSNSEYDIVALSAGTLIDESDSIVRQFHHSSSVGGAASYEVIVTGSTKLDVAYGATGSFPMYAILKRS